jgi:hypothetical protein
VEPFVGGPRVNVIEVDSGAHVGLVRDEEPDRPVGDGDVSRLTEAAAAPS